MNNELATSFLYINNKKLQMKSNAWNFTILQLCEKTGISVPRFCYHRELSIVGNCRMCMVELKSVMKPVIACATSLNKEMHIFTNSELVKQARSNVLEFLLINHPLDCPICDQGGECDLQDQAFLYGSDKSRFIENKRSVEDKNFGPIIKTVMSRCIHCTRCIRYAEEIIGIFSLGTMGRGKETEISTYNNSILQHEMIGNIADICPVGALLIKPTAFRARTWDLENIDLLDIFDSLVGTASLGVKGGELIRILPRRNDLLNREWITDKIRFFYEGSKINRLLFPLVKKNNELVHCSTKFAIEYYTNKLLLSYKEKNSFIAFIGEELSYYDSFLISNYCNILNFKCFYIDQYKKELNVDLRFNWLLNSNIQFFLKKSNLLFLNVNMKYECAIINTLLYKNLNENENQKIYYIGNVFKNSYSIIHLGLGNITLNKIQKGQHNFCLSLLFDKYHWVESGVQPLFNFSISNYLNSIKLYVLSSKYSYLALNSTEINLLENGIDNISILKNFADKNFSLIHFFGNAKKMNSICKYNNYKVYFSHHMPEKYINLFDLYFPIINFYEWNKKLSGPKTKLWLNNQLMGQILFNFMVVDVSDADTYHGYISFFLNNLKKFNILNIELYDVLENISLYFKEIEIGSRYVNGYKNLFEISNMVNGFVNDYITHEVSLQVYYKSNVYISNSLTLSAVYDNHITANLENKFINELYL